VRNRREINLYFSKFGVISLFQFCDITRQTLMLGSLLGTCAR
jgi:hypothetical protein